MTTEPISTPAQDHVLDAPQLPPHRVPEPAKTRGETYVTVFRSDICRLVILPKLQSTYLKHIDNIDSKAEFHRLFMLDHAVEVSATTFFGWLDELKITFRRTVAVDGLTPTPPAGYPGWAEALSRQDPIRRLADSHSPHMAPGAPQEDNPFVNSQQGVRFDNEPAVPPSPFLPGATNPFLQ